jgi:tetratricopeptide (TPR) repeat protein
MPLVGSLLSAAFSPGGEAPTELTALQRYVLTCMVNSWDLWRIVNLECLFRTYGLPQDRNACAQLIGVPVADDDALTALRSGLDLAEVGFLEEARQDILRALAIDSEVLDRCPSPDEAWLLCANAFADTDPKRAIEAFNHANSISPGVLRRVQPTWRLAELLDEQERDR